MIHALGFSHNQDFNPEDPGRLCRGRERWIAPWYAEQPPEGVHRLVISGAAFTDDSARDAVRGIPHSKIELATLVSTLFPRAQFLAFMEDGHPADIPEGAEGVELYSGHRAGGLSEEMLVRWTMPVKGVANLRELLGPDPQVEVIRGLLVVDGALPEGLTDLIFELTGMSTLDSPPARFQPAVLPDLLEVVPAVVLFHRDKHGPALGVYSREVIRTDSRLEGLCAKQDTLLVPFAIPPMLARWDRALSELRAVWEAEKETPFPVPESDEPSGWEPRWKRRKRKKRDAEARKELREGGVDDETDDDDTEEDD